MRFGQRLLIPMLALLLPLSAFAALEPTEIQSSALKSVARAFEKGHYRSQQLDDKLSALVFDRYIEILDPSRSYFLQSDIDNYSRFRDQIDDQIRKGDLSVAYSIYDLYLTRFNNRQNYLLDKLAAGISYQFTDQDALPVSREDAPWFADQAEADNYWDKRLKSALLNLKLADRTKEEAVETLTKRYTAQRNRAQQSEADDVFQTFANALANSYDPHTSYFSPRVSENFQINMSLSLEGIGAVLQTEDEFTKIVSLVPAGPADKSGQLNPADLIVGVAQGEDGEFEDVVGMRLDDVVQLIRGPKDSVVRLEVIPAGATDGSGRRIVSLVRNKVQLEEQAAQSRVIRINREGVDYKLGVIEVPAFYIDFAALQKGDPNYRSTTRDVAMLIDELKQQEIDGLIIDLRDNGGGSLREANELVGLFISRGPTVQIRDSNGRVDVLGDYDPQTAWTGPLTVMINRLSASASEIFAGAIQDYRRGLVVGNRSFGKGTVQTLQPLEHGQVKLTTAKFYRISGESTQHQGVAPDINFPALIDEQEIGESALDFALPWDQVRPVRYGRYSQLDRWLPELNNRSKQRTAGDPDFNHMREELRLIKEQKGITQIPLNEQALRDQREKFDKAQLDIENARRRAKNETPIASLDDLLAETEPTGSQPLNADSEALIRESGELTVDLIELQLQHGEQLKG
ncbi:MAG TPA: carboxy terminal-processing peptidase [Marinobacterium sp.]|nr:carboxy terminal-processing peptidase [Marinobacterium sp.]